MKKVFLSVLVSTGLLLSAAYTTNQARNHVGERATVCGAVSGGYYADRLGASPLLSI